MWRCADQKHVVIGATVLSVILFSFGLMVSGQASTFPQNTEDSLKDYFQRLADTDMTFHIGFVAPIKGVYVGWDVPAELESEGEVVGARMLKEIADEYLCIGEIGLGIETVYCIPYSNIAYVSQPGLPPSS